MNDTQLRKFLSGDKNVGQNYPTDVMIWLNYQGHKLTQIKGRPANALIKRDEHPTVSLEKYLTKFVEYLFRPDMSRLKKEELYIKWTNRMDEVDADLIYRITSGQMEFDLDTVRAYAGDRTIGGAPGGEYIFRDEYLEKVPEAPAPEAKAKKPTAPVDLDTIGATFADLEELNGPKEATEQKPSGDTGTGSTGNPVVSEASTQAPVTEAPKRRGGRRKKTEAEAPKE
ncbi:hypothetical protein EVB81_026 [Rhizobium phage RHph_I46]|uniref:Uncharacterized protein n=1 Tax=Rhizobium phage RHph_I1_9 TaxID=2509729 RepID=A0A7S5UZJ9_9CAUD|nr:hypothetical protein PP936_gp026 [Rhizobium phage RHph_I1_9]QIG69595.1 hypothetical protein EVB81_026 [Rhizobium phage RHph_I46]QIG70876.1 hypothetical protein EVB92_026 [Rhizobium phage RHph_I9]QIG73463.1 hypothetical protein EVC04_026 [Rhizobium phage RHph_I1_9]QIG76215.1 hypothetical protein EVC25_026 [Rhizobium phage RHph_I34]